MDLKSDDIAALIYDETLDIDYNDIQIFGYKITDLIVDYLKNIKIDRISPSKTFEEFKNLVEEPIPEKEKTSNEVLDECQQKIISNAVRIGNPRLLGWILSSCNPIGAFAEEIASILNQNVSRSGAGIATAVEIVVIDWIKKILGYDDYAAGILVSGGSVGNLICINIARNNKAGYDIRSQGIKKDKDLVIYASKQAHYCIQKAVEILGIGSDNISWVVVNDKFEMDINDLKEKIMKDKLDGKLPFAVVATAGTVNTGAIDPLNDLANICKKNNLWLHVDAAYGGFAALSKKYKYMLNGISQADSIVINPHKWLFIPYEAGCVLVKNPKHMVDSYRIDSPYLSSKDDKKFLYGDVDFSDYGIQLSRSFRALKIWMSLKHYGIEKYGRIIEQNIHLAQYFAALLKESSDFNVDFRGNLSTVCFQYYPKDLYENYQKSDSIYQKRIDVYINKLNQIINESMRKDGRILLSSTILNNNYVLRACIVNFRTTKKDIQYIIEVIRELGIAADNKNRKTRF